MGGKELELLFYASPLFLSLRFTFLKPKAVFIYIVRTQSAVRGPQSVFYTDRSSLFSTVFSSAGGTPALDCLYGNVPLDRVWFLTSLS